MGGPCRTSLNTICFDGADAEDEDNMLTTLVIFMIMIKIFVMLMMMFNTAGVTLMAQFSIAPS